MPDTERVVQQLYEDVAVRADLRDTEAEALLRWAEKQVERLAATAPDDATFDEQAGRLRSLLKRVNRVVGARSLLDETEIQAAMAKLAEDAVALGAPPATSFSSQTAPDLKSLDDATALQTVLASLHLDAEQEAESSPTSAPPPEATPPAAPEPPADPSAAASDSDDAGPVYPGRTPLILWPRSPSGESDPNDETPDIEEQ